jgi:hypothetical protein
MKEQPKNPRQWIRLIYLYLFACIGLVVVVIGTVRGINVGLKATIFRNADRFVSYPVPADKDQEKMIKEQEVFQQLDSQRQREMELAGAISMIVVGLPLYLYHWKLIQKEQKG